MNFIRVLQRVVIVLILLFVSIAITPPDQALACTWGSGAKPVNQKLVTPGWSVEMTAAINVDTCGHVRLAYATCLRSTTPGFSVNVTWCGAYYPSGKCCSTRIDVGFNATIIAPARTTDVWSRRWATINGPLAQRYGCGGLC